ncbi:MAG: Na/Pi cotransporter family protein [Lachnospiraceae bacterium]|nr:Na/Pi cotransporter family protein [Lachnospiraceae bacterium]
MTVFDLLTMIGGLALFLFGMSLMSSSLEKRAGNRLKSILGNMTGSLFKGLLLGLGVTVVIQSSSATTVMVVGFVNSGVMTLEQSVGVIMGANLGASVTSWLLSTSGISGDSLVMQLLKPSSFTPVLALIGIVLFMFTKNQKKKDTGMILLGFAVLMFGMETMSGAVSVLAETGNFEGVIKTLQNPVLGVLVGLVFTAIIQSSGASVGILQALTLTGMVPYLTAVPIIMGQNIGTCVTAMISCIGTGKNARRAAVIHLSFNLIATLILLPAWYLLLTVPVVKAFFSSNATPLGIAVVHTAFKLIALAILIPFNKKLVSLSKLLVRDGKGEEDAVLLDDRLLGTPSAAILRCKTVLTDMGELAVNSMKMAFRQLDAFDEKDAAEIRGEEEQVDKFEDALGTYLVKLASQPRLSESDSAEITKMLHLLGDFERISDHAVNILESAEEVHEKKLSFSDDAKHELSVLISAVSEILDLALSSYEDTDLKSAVMVEPLEQVVDDLRDMLKKQHIARLQRGECTIELGFVLTDLLTNLERISDHCSNIAGCMLEMEHDNMDIHEYLRRIKQGDVAEFNGLYENFTKKYAL